MNRLLINLVAVTIVAAGSTCAQASDRPRDLVGCWKNEMQDPNTGGWRTLSWYNFEIKDGEPAMTALDYTIVAKDVFPPDWIARIKAGGGQWSYAMRVQGRVHQVELQRVTSTHYEGTYSIDGQLQGPRRRLVKMETRREQLAEINEVLRKHEIARRTTEQLIAFSQGNRTQLGQEIDRAEWQTRRLADGTLLRAPTGTTGSIPRVNQMFETARLARDRLRLQEILHRIRIATETRDWLRE